MSIAALSESSSDPEDSEVGGYNDQSVVNVPVIEKVFVTGVLDELKVCFYYSREVRVILLI